MSVIAAVVQCRCVHMSLLPLYAVQALSKSVMVLCSDEVLAGCHRNSLPLLGAMSL